MPTAILKTKNKSSLSTWEILGGKHFMPTVPKTNFEYIKVVNSGIKKQSVTRLAQLMNIPMKDMAALLNISYKTLGRKRESDKLDTISSSLSIEIAEVLSKGFSVFEDVGKLSRWLQKPNRALQGEKPIDLLNTPTGIKMIIRLLGRIEEGIYT